MTKGEAFYRAILAHLALPDARGTQARVIEVIGDLCTQPQLSDWKRGKRQPAEETVASIGGRLGFTLCEHWTWQTHTPPKAAAEPLG